MSDDESESTEMLERKDENDTQVTAISQDLHTIAHCLNPDFSGNTNDRISKLDATHLYMVVFYLFALIAFSVSTGIVPNLNANRAFILTIGVISPAPNSTGDALQDQFMVEDKLLSKLPPTVLICVMTGVYFAYHTLHGLLYRNWTREYVARRINTARWVTMAIARTMESYVLFVLNGERNLVALLLLAGSIFGACYLANTLDIAVANCHSIKSTEKTNGEGKRMCKTLYYYKDVVNNGQALIVLVAIIVASFILHLCYNKQATANWVMGVSIAFVIFHALSAVLYVWMTWNCQCSRKWQEYYFVRGDWKITMYNMVLYTVFSTILFTYFART